MNFFKFLFLFIIFFIFYNTLSIFAYENTNSLVESKNLYENLDKYEMRAAWITTVFNNNMPSGMNKKDFQIWANKVTENLCNLGFNTIVFQIRPNGDALYESKIVPWSSYITGKKQGTNPLYDPLDILINSAHEKGLELHAWINPYRITTSSMNLDDLSKNNIALKHPEWIVKYGNAYYLNPGIPDVQNHLINVVKEIVENYDIDAIHVDDYFYPYTIENLEYPDKNEFKKYGNKFQNIGDWRRNNITNLIENINKSIKESKYWVQLGISPFGVWKNKVNDITGSDTSALEAYYNVYADTREWIKKGIIDYITPQIYWSTDFKNANFNILINWWANEINTYAYLKPVNLYIGLADYKINKNSAEKAWKNPMQLSDQININRSNPYIKGQMHFSYGSVENNMENYMTIISKNLYNNKSLTPPTYWNNNEIPNIPDNLNITKDNKNINININTNDKITRKYAIYRFNGNKENNYNNKNLLAVIYKNKSNIFIDTKAIKGNTYTYGIKAISYTGIESNNAKVITINY